MKILQNILFLSASGMAFILLFLIPGQSQGGESLPVVMLIQAKGQVSYSPGGNKWKPVKRNRFLYEGYRLRTGKDAYCRIIDRQTQEITEIREFTEIEIHGDGHRVWKGSIPDAEPADTVMSFLNRKFSSVQKYTAIRRNDGSQRQMENILKISLSGAYPDLVWENRGAKFSYRLTVGENVYAVPASKEEMIRFGLSGLKPGIHPYHIEVLYQGEPVSRSPEEGRIHWFSNAENRVFLEREEKIRMIDPDNGFLMGNVLDEYGFKVAAMDRFREFLSENPDINEVRPFLMKVYDDLKLSRLKQTEALLYYQQRENIFPAD